MRMARINVYLPDELAESVKAAEINVSAVAQEALVAELGKRSLLMWLERIDGLAPVDVA